MRSLRSALSSLTVLLLSLGISGEVLAASFADAGAPRAEFAYSARRAIRRGSLGTPGATRGSTAPGRTGTRTGVRRRSTGTPGEFRGFRGGELRMGIPHRRSIRRTRPKTNRGLRLRLNSAEKNAAKKVMRETMEKNAATPPSY